MKEELIKKIESLAKVMNVKIVPPTENAIQISINEADDNFNLYSKINKKTIHSKLKDIWIKKYAFENLKENFGLSMREEINNSRPNQKNYDGAYHLINSAEQEKNRLINLLY
jgi:hypothetical protein